MRERIKKSGRGGLNRVRERIKKRGRGGLKNHQGSKKESLKHCELGFFNLKNLADC